MPLKSNCAHCGTICFSRSKEEKLCKPCSGKKRRKHPDRKSYKREWSLLKKYNIDNIDFETIWIAFKGKCGILGWSVDGLLEYADGYSELNMLVIREGFVYSSLTDPEVSFKTVSLNWLLKYKE